jgi:hypothetical protein
MGEPREAAVRLARSLAVAVVLLSAVAGCGKKADEPPPKVPVKGRVLNASDQPMPFVLVHFHPQAANVPRPSSVATGKTGAFSLECPPGKYKVTLTNPPIQSQGGGPIDGKAPGHSTTIPGRYRELETTPLRPDIPEGGTNDLVLKVN